MAEGLDYITRKTTQGRYSYSEKTQRFYCCSNGRFVSRDIVKESQLITSMGDAFRKGQILSR
jgi:hypothetical protein